MVNRRTFTTSLASLFAASLQSCASPAIVLMDGLGTLKTDTKVALAESSGQSITPDMMLGPRFHTTVPTKLTEVGVFVNYCYMRRGTYTCASSPLILRLYEFADQSFPEYENGCDSKQNCQEFTFPAVSDARVFSYSSVNPQVTLEPQRYYFAMFTTASYAMLLGAAKREHSAARHQARAVHLLHAGKRGRLATFSSPLAMRILGSSV